MTNQKVYIIDHSVFHGSEKEQLEYVVDALRLAGNQGLRVDGLPRKGALAAQSKGFAEAERGYLYITPKGKNSSDSAANGKFDAQNAFEDSFGEVIEYK